MLFYDLARETDFMRRGPHTAIKLQVSPPSYKILLGIMYISGGCRRVAVNEGDHCIQYFISVKTVDVCDSKQLHSATWRFPCKTSSSK
jgi:hypothetical protein